MFSQQCLTTNQVVLQPLSHKHLAGLYHAGQDPTLWRWVLNNYTKTPEILTEWFLKTAQFDKNQQVVFAIIDKATQQVVGTTRLFKLDSHHLSAEIGHTFITSNYQRTYINSQAKYLLLHYAFEQLGLVRISFNTHQQNKKSRNAIMRLGACFEGIAHKDRLLSDGSYRNTAKFSIIDEQWPSIKQQLEERL